MKARLILSILIVCLPACRGGVTPERLSLPTPVPALQEKTPPPAYPAAPGKPGVFQPAACPFSLPSDLVEGESVECGYLSVEENRAASPGRLIRLAVAVFHPPGGATSPDPVIYLSGGPGASALELIRYQFDLLSGPAFAAGRDLVVFDQRGVGISRPALDCPGYDELGIDLLDRQVDGREMSEEEAGDLVLESLRACREELSKSADLSAYNTAASASDVEDLRLALGFQQVNLWGGSYGTRLALEVMRRYPGGLRSVVLDAVYPPDVDLNVEAPANYSRALERMFVACEANPVCSQAYPDLRRVFFETVDRLNADPVSREVENPFTGESYQSWMNGNTILALTFQLLYDSKIRYLIPQYIYAASQEDYTAFDQARGSLIGLIGLSSRGMMFSVQCHDELAFSSLEAFQAELARYPDLAGMYANSILGGLAYRACQFWDAGQAETSANQPVSSAVPTLLMNGEFDPITPPAWGQHAAETLENAFVYVYPGVGHGASGVEGCPQHMMSAFLLKPDTHPDDTCITGMNQ
jgi:pimeloyl-ACP methyl ester carboxylesterase